MFRGQRSRDQVETRNRKLVCRAFVTLLLMQLLKTTPTTSSALRTARGQEAEETRAAAAHAPASFAARQVDCGRLHDRQARYPLRSVARDAPQSRCRRA